jgi:16S rRNA (guanine1207-N2)-methyltransferase
VAVVPSPDGPQEPGVTAPGHYFSDDPAAASRRSTVRLTLPERTLDLVTDRGVFSPDRVDPGTKLLLLELPELPPLPAGPVVDVGCGYGPIACAVAARHPGREVWAVDVNRRARDLTAENARRLGLQVRVVAPEEVPADLRVAAVVSNPPIRIGKSALQGLVTTWLDRLEPAGSAWLVVNKHLGADSLASWLTARGHAVERVRSRQGYRVLVVSGSGPDPRAT